MWLNCCIHSSSLYAMTCLEEKIKRLNNWSVCCKKIWRTQIYEEWLSLNFFIARFQSNTIKLWARKTSWFTNTDYTTIAYSLQTASNQTSSQITLNILNIIKSIPYLKGQFILQVMASNKNFLNRLPKPKSSNHL